jgi:ribonuclease T2
MRLYLALVTMILSLPGALRAEGEAAGDFDYYILSLGWSPTWCATTGDARGDDQCNPRHAYGFTLHGLWPQNESGWPSYCRTTARDPGRSETAAMADITGSGGLAWYEWKKHGRCSGLTADAYFRLAREAYGTVTIPQAFRQLDRDITLPARLVEDAFMEANPDLAPQMVTITCDEGRVQEVRVCLSKDLEPRPCGADAARDCRAAKALMEKIR